MKINKKEGFTLIELMIVVAIIGILAAIAIPNFLGMQEKAKRRYLEESIAEAKSDLHNWLDATAKSETGVIDLDGNGVVGSHEGPCAFLSNVPSSWLNALIVKRGEAPQSPWFRKSLYTTVHNVYSGGILISQATNDRVLKLVSYGKFGKTMMEEVVAIE